MRTMTRGDDDDDDSLLHDDMMHDPLVASPVLAAYGRAPLLPSPALRGAPGAGGGGGGGDGDIGRMPPLELGPGAEVTVERSWSGRVQRWSRRGRVTVSAIAGGRAWR